MCAKRRIVPDGDGFGVQEYSKHYCSWDFINDEPLLSIAEARAWLREYDAGGVTDWEIMRRAWARGEAYGE